MRGTAVSPGIGRGTAYVLACGVGAPALRREIAADEVGGELARFDAALGQAEQDLLALKKAVDDSIGPSEGDIFAAQALVVRDPILRNQVSALVRDQRINVESAVAEIVQRFTRAFDDIPDPYLRERAADIRDVGRRVLSALVDEQEQLEVPEGSVVVADELLPSVTARLDLGGVRALVSEHGGRFSHTSILARSQGTPSVVGIAGAALAIKTGDRVIVDGISGVVFVNPPRAVEREYERLETDIRAGKDKLHELVDLPAVTADGTAIGLFANASKLADTEAAMLYKADGDRPLSHRVRLRDPQRASDRGGAVRVSREGRHPPPPAANHLSAARRRGRQAAVVAAAPRVPQSVAGRAGHPSVAQAPRRAEAPAPRLPEGERHASDLHPASRRGRPRGDSPHAPDHRGG